MRTWTRVRVRDLLCQRCGGAMRRGDLVQEIRLVGVTRALLRCVSCAEGAPPADVPELPPLTRPVIAPSPKPETHATQRFPFRTIEDFKQKQSGDAA